MMFSITFVNLKRTKLITTNNNFSKKLLNLFLTMSKPPENCINIILNSTVTNYKKCVGKHTFIILTFFRYWALQLRQSGF